MKKSQVLINDFENMSDSKMEKMDIQMKEAWKEILKAQNMNYIAGIVLFINCTY